MGDVITRKCACCKGKIEIDRNHISDVILFNKLYYHSKCFEEMATKKAASKRGKPQMWQDALDRMWEIEAETKKVLGHFFDQDDLNEWLLGNYNITTIPSRFWQIVADLEGGKYKGKRCKSVSMSTLSGCWKWGQKKLNEIHQYNKAHNKGPSDDNARIMYDLAILIGKVPNYLTYKEKQKMAKNEVARVMFDDIDMSKIGQSKQATRKDVSDISNDIFVE